MHQNNGNAQETMYLKLLKSWFRQSYFMDTYIHASNPIILAISHCAPCIVMFWYLSSNCIWIKLGVTPHPPTFFHYSPMVWQCLHITRYVSSNLKDFEFVWRPNQYQRGWRPGMQCMTYYVPMHTRTDSMFLGTMIGYPIQEVAWIHSEGVIRLKYWRGHLPGNKLWLNGNTSNK